MLGQYGATVTAEVAVMSAKEELIEELRREVKDKRRAALVDAYTKKPTADAIATKALEILAEEIDAIEKP
jgi:hypothetical protein